jgi:hypothetical protein
MSDDPKDTAEPAGERVADDEGYALGPADNADRPTSLPPLDLSPADVQRIKDAICPPPPADERFSLGGLFAIVTAAAVLLGVGIRLPRPLFAGLAGVATLVGIAVLSLSNSPSAALRVAWWVLLVIYLLAIGAAVWGR